MFNCIGFANYRYFVMFLFYVTIACTYGVVLTLSDFAVIAGPGTPRIIRGVHITNQMRTAVMFTFVLALSVGIAVAILFSWHVQMQAASS
jgi:palmitoyltransferase